MCLLFSSSLPLFIFSLPPAPPVCFLNYLTESCRHPDTSLLNTSEGTLRVRLYFCKTTEYHYLIKENWHQFIISSNVLSIWEFPQLFPALCFLPVFFFSPNTVHSRFLWLYLYFLASFYVITLTPHKSQGQLA